MQRNYHKIAKGLYLLMLSRGSYHSELQTAGRDGTSSFCINVLRTAAQPSQMPRQQHPRSLFYPPLTCLHLLLAGKRCRRRPDHFKGFSAAEVAGVYAGLDLVAAETAARKAEAAAATTAAEEALRLQAAACNAMADEAEERRRQEAREYYASLQVEASVRKARDGKARDEERSRQFPADSGILAGFGTSLR